MKPFYSDELAERLEQLAQAAQDHAEQETPGTATNIRYRGIRYGYSHAAQLVRAWFGTTEDMPK